MEYLTDERLEELMEDEQTSETKGFEVNDDNCAEWCLKRISETEAEADRIKRIAEHQIEELQEQIKKIDDQTERKTGFLKNALRKYFFMVPHKETKTQESYKLLSGSLVYKKPSKKMVKDDEKLLAAVKAGGWGYIKTKESVDWAEFKKQLEITDDGQIIIEDTGEVVDGVTLEETEGSFDVKI